MEEKVTVQPEDIAAAEKIYTALTKYFADVRGGYDSERPDIAALIAASRPPQVARLVGENERLRRAAALAIGRCIQNVAMTPEDEAWCLGPLRAALSPAPALDLAKIERALEAGREANALLSHDPTRTEALRELYRGHAERIAAALSDVREVRRA